MVNQIPLIKLSELPVGRGRRVCSAGLDLAIFHIGAEVFAIDDSCPHAGASLSNGRLQGSKVVCPAHGLRFDLVGTACPSAEILDTNRYPIQVVDGLVVLTTSEQASITQQEQKS